MTTRVQELFGMGTTPGSRADWCKVVRDQRCPFLDRKCLKTRKIAPQIAIGTCTVRYGREDKNVIICPHRLLERKQVFLDCLHLLTLHEPGNEVHVVPEVSIPGGSIDYVLTSAKGGRVKDFVGIEFQTLDTTGTVWPERQRFLDAHGMLMKRKDVATGRGFGVNWKMTAKTVLVQLHHKVKTFQHINRHLVLALQDHLLGYMCREFSFNHLQAARLGDPMHLHSYSLVRSAADLRLELTERLSTDANGISICLGLQANANMELEQIVNLLESKLSSTTLLRL